MMDLRIPGLSFQESQDLGSQDHGTQGCLDPRVLGAGMRIMQECRT